MGVRSDKAVLGRVILVSYSMVCRFSLVGYGFHGDAWVSGVVLHLLRGIYYARSKHVGDGGLCRFYGCSCWFRGVKGPFVNQYVLRGCIWMWCCRCELLAVNVYAARFPAGEQFGLGVGVAGCDGRGGGCLLNFWVDILVFVGLELHGDA